MINRTINKNKMEEKHDQRPRMHTYHLPTYVNSIDFDLSMFASYSEQYDVRPGLSQWITRFICVHDSL